MLIILTIAACLMVYPSFAASISDYRQTLIISGLSGDLQKLSSEEVFSLKQSAEQFNEMVFASQRSRPYRYTGESYEDPLYDAQLKTSPLSSVMGYLEIPFTGAYIPIVHGTRSEELTYQAGHLYGTSLPWGGINTHAVIGAHTGLTNAKLFDGLEKAAPGDAVLIHVLDEIHIYTVTDINTVLPEAADNYLQTEAGRDLLTLYTCTPPGINSHRLLVRCERTGTMQADSSAGGQGRTDSRNTAALIRAICWALVPLAVLTVGLFLVKRSGKKEKRHRQ